MKEALGIPDRRIAQTVSAIGELEEALCACSERLKDWYSLYYPEAATRIKKQEAFARIVSDKKLRSEFTDITQDSIGADLAPNDIHHIRAFAKSLALLYSEKGQLEEYLEKLMKKDFKNLYAVAGAPVGAKLIAHCGDAARLANLPSSTIQVLGAEKALFRHMKTGAKPPKYGIILSHNLLQNAKHDERGKVARAIASVISIAVKVDVFSQEDNTEFLTKKLENKLKVIERRRLKKRGLEPGKEKGRSKHTDFKSPKKGGKK